MKRIGGVVFAGILMSLVGLLALGIGLLTDAPQAYSSYLTAYATGLSLALGALALVMTTQITGARWFVTLRPLAEAITGTLPLLVILYLPLLGGLHQLYPWVAATAGYSPELQQQIRETQPYLNLPFFLLRTAFYFAVWVGLSFFLRQRPTEAAGSRSSRQRGISAAGLPALGLTVTFAAFDWLMSLSPGWFSTIYGLYYFAGGFLGALALMAVAAAGVHHAGRLSEDITTEQYHALGKLLLTFVVFWAYIAYSQFLIVWIGDIPQEATWYLPRMRGSWAAVGVGLIAGQFALPFLFLLFRAVTTHRIALAAVGIWLLVMHYLDLYWLVQPQLHPDGVHFHWLDLTTLLVVGGAMIAGGGWTFRHTSKPAAGASPEMMTAAQGA